jgi:hypothetical protein
MCSAMSKLAKLTDDQLQEIRKFEKRWNNVMLLAYEKSAEPATLSPEQLDKIRSLEKELGVVIVAYRIKK